jgi:hypothetical protein
MGGNVVVKLNLNSSGYSAEMAKAQKAMKSFGDTAKEAGHGTVTQMQAASASIRLLEGDMTRNVRAVEKFITTIPGVGAALQAAFPIVGLVAFAGVVSKIVTEVIRAKDALAQVRNVANESFEALTEGAHKNADALRVTNDRLEAQIAIMEHKPVNNMALALDEARLRADELATSLNKDYDAFKKVIEQGQANTLNNLLGNGVDKGLGAGMQDQLANIRTLARQQRDELRVGNQSGADATGKKLRAAQDASLAFADQQTGVRSEIANAGDADFKASYLKKQGMNLDAIGAFKDLVSGQVDVGDQQQRNTADEATKQRLEAAKAGAEALKKQQEEMLKLFENQERQQNAFNKMSVNDEIQFWTDRLSAFTRGSDLYLQVQNKIYSEISKRPDLTKTNRETQAKVGKSQVEGEDLLGGGAQALQRLQIEQDEARSKAAEKYNQIVAVGNAEQEKAATAFAEMSVGIALAQGAISRLDAAQALAAIHADDNAKALKRVNDELATQIGLINADNKLSADEKTAAIRNVTAGAANQTGAINATYSKQQAQDNAAIGDSTISGAVRNSLNEMVQSFTDMAQNLRHVIPETLNSLNSNIAKAITGHGSKQDFGRTLTGAGQGLIQAGLQRAEGGILQKFGLGKRDGSSAMAALWVQVAQGTSGLSTTNPTVSSTVGSLASMVPGGSFIQPFLKAGMNFLPHFAAGGDFMSGNPMIVGEKGPEMLVPKSSGTIIPNHALGGGDTHHHFNIDARGSNDPAATEAAVRRGMHQAVAASLQASQQHAKRTPQGR